MYQPTLSLKYYYVCDKNKSYVVDKKDLSITDKIVTFSDVPAT